MGQLQAVSVQLSRMGHFGVKKGQNMYYVINCSIKICKLVKNFTILPTITVDQAGYDSNIEMPQFGNKDKLEMSDITLLPAISPSETMQLSKGLSILGL